METVWKTAKGTIVIQKNDGFFLENGDSVNTKGKTPEELGWQEQIPEPVIETISSGPTSNSKPSNGIILQGLDMLTPNRATGARAGKSALAQFTPNSPALQYIGELAGGAAGLGMDAVSALYSPARAATSVASPLVQKGIQAFIKSKPLEAAKNLATKLNPSFNAPTADKILNAAKEIFKAGMPKGGNVPGSKSLPVLGLKNFTQNVGDAAVFNNLERMAKGEDLQLGSAELAGGLTGGTVGTVAEKKIVNDVLRTRNAVSNNAESLNFAKAATGKKGMRAVEEIIDNNIAKHGNFDKAVNNLRMEADALSKEMGDFMSKAGVKEIPYPTLNLREQIDSYVLDVTSQLGNKNSLRYADKALESLDEALKEVYLARKRQTGVRKTRAQALEAKDMPVEELYKQVPSLTLAELDKIKRDLQHQSSHWIRSEGAMAREGTESLATKEASSAINNMLDEFSELLDQDFARHIENNAQMLNPSEAQKFREINNKRWETIGNLKIMEKAAAKQARRDDYISGMTNAINDINAQNRMWVPSLTRWTGSRLEQEESPLSQFTKTEAK